MSPDTWQLVFWAFAGPVIFAAWCAMMAVVFYCLAKVARWLISVDLDEPLWKPW